MLTKWTLWPVWTTEVPIGRRDSPPESLVAPLTWRTVLIEWSVLCVAILAFCAGPLNLFTQRNLSGNETLMYQGLDSVLLYSLSTYGRVPLWNPYYHTGLPYFADPLLHLFNPFVTLPVLLFGVQDGFKIGLVLSFLAAGLGMWWLGAVLGLGPAGRLWMALMWTFSGQAVARFFQGQYLFTLGFAWMSWLCLGMIGAVQTGRRLYVAVAAVALALTFFSGHLYYAYYAAIVLALFVPVATLSFQRKPPRLLVDLGRAKTLLMIAVLALGLTAIQLLPMLAFGPGRSPADPTLATAHSLDQIWLDYTHPGHRGPIDNGTIRVEKEDYYAYIGLWPFLGLIFLPLAITRTKLRLLLFFCLLFALAIMWADMRDTPLRELYQHVGLMQNFRYPTRFLVYGALAVIVLAAMGMDGFWKRAWPRAQAGLGSMRQVAGWGAWRAALVLLTVFMVWSVLDLYQVNRPIIGVQDDHEPFESFYEAAKWLKDYDSSAYYVLDRTGSNYHAAYTLHGLRYFRAYDIFIDDFRKLSNIVNRRPIEVGPKYVIELGSETPHEPDAALAGRVGKAAIWHLPHSLPYAFTVKDSELARGADAGPLRRADVTPLLPYVASTDSVEIIAEGDGASTLVLMMLWDPYWQLRVDGRPEASKNVGGYLATEQRPGVHKYDFVYDPAPVKLGLLLSLVSLLAVLGLVVSDARLRWPYWSQRYNRAVGRIMSYSPHLPLSQAKVLTLRARRWLPHSLVRLLPSTQVQLLALALGGFSLAVYVVTRLVALDEFPIYFFCDEALQAVAAAELLERGLRDARGRLFPVYFDSFGFLHPLISVYAYAASELLFGKSIIIVRTTAVLLTVPCVVAVALILKLIFQIRYWWASILVLTITPAWFLHSRTAFENAGMVSLYACFLLCYLLYRYRSPHFLYPALAFAMGTVYAYSSGQIVIGVSGLLLALSDLRYHLRNWRTLLVGLGLLAILAVPYYQWRTEQPEGVTSELRRVSSYLIQPQPIEQKLLTFTTRYAYGLSPQYWFLPNEQDIIRHRMQGIGHLLLITLPFFLIGVGLCLRRLNSSAHRAVLIAALAAPVAGALTDIGITRILAFVVPAALFTTLGLDFLLGWLRGPVAQLAAAVGVAAGLSLAGVWMVHYALVGAPTWTHDYGLYGMQWGAKQIFETLKEDLNRDPNSQYLLTPSWANGTDVFLKFFLPNESRVTLRNVDGYTRDKLPLNPNMVFIMMPNEYRAAQESGKFEPLTIERTLHYPDGSDGFYWVRPAYVESVEALFAADREERRRLVTDQVLLGGEPLTVRHSRFDSGNVAHLFDGDVFTLARGLEANPLILELEFARPRPLAGLAADFAHMELELTVLLTSPDGDTVPYSTTVRNVPTDLHVELPFDRGPDLVAQVRMEVQYVGEPEPAHIHVRELAFR